MVRLRPFAALRPLPNLAARVASVPYDVVDRDEAGRLAAGNTASFLHVVRAEIDLPPETDPYDQAVYEQARRNLRRLLDEGILVRETAPAVYLYRLVGKGRSQLGLVGCCHVDDYEAGVIKRHEKTRRDKEDDRTRHILTTGAQTGPVLLTYRDAPGWEYLARRDVNSRPLFHFVAPDGVTHTVWAAPEPREYVELFESVETAYVADGHHRAASAARAAAERRQTRGEGEHDWFLAALFPASRLTILPYNRVVTEAGLAPAETKRRLASVGRLAETGRAEPGRAGVFCAYLEGRWHELELDPATIDGSDPVGSLDVALLQDRVLEPVFGITDPRGDPRLDFVGGIRGTAELERRVDAGAACAFSLHPTSIDQLLAVADAGLIMPPKSTWFEPKLRSGLLVHEL